MNGSVVFATVCCAPAPNAFFLGPTGVLNANGISICSDVFAALTNVTDKATDRPRYSSVTIGRTYVRSTAMRPNNVQNRNNSKSLTIINVSMSILIPRSAAVAVISRED